MKSEFSIIIPTLNEADSLAATLDALKDFGEAVEIIVADGGSGDATLEIAESRRVRIVHTARGRGRQLRAGANAATGAIFWFIHADTTVSPEAFAELKTSMRNAAIIGGNCTLRFDGERFAAKFLTWLYPKLNLLGLIYGDSAIFVRRGAYEQIGGFKSYPIFEDLDFVQRLRKVGRLTTLSSVVVTSSRKFEKKSFLLTFARWTFLQILYWCGVSPETLLKIYFSSGKFKS